MNHKTINYINHKKNQQTLKTAIAVGIRILLLALLSLGFAYAFVKGLDRSLDNWECRTGQTCDWVDGELKERCQR